MYFKYEKITDPDNPNVITGCIITGYTGNETELRIPGEIDGKPVVKIGDRAFSGCASLTSITFPASLTEIGVSAFNYCRKLVSIVLPDNLTRIGSHAFADCYDLESVTIPASVTEIGSCAFCNCMRLTNVTIPEGVIKIGSRAFAECYRLESVTLPESVREIGSDIFDNHKALSVSYGGKSFTGDGIFSIEDIDRLLKCINVGEPQVKITNGILEKASGRLTEYEIPDTVTEIGSAAFSDCVLLTKVSGGENLKTIGGDAFNHCIYLPSIKIPDSVIQIGNSVFYGCENLESVTYRGKAFGAEQLHALYGYINYGEEGLIIEEGVLTGVSDYFKEFKTETDIPDGVTQIGCGAFSGCAHLTSVTIPEGVTTIERNTFDGCTRLRTVTLPSTLTHIGTYVFFNCSHLSNIDLPDGIKDIRPSAFEGCGKVWLHYKGGNFPTIYDYNRSTDKDRKMRELRKLIGQS